MPESYMGIRQAPVNDKPGTLVNILSTNYAQRKESGLSAKASMSAR
jgi:hypothetical protein